MKSKQFTNEFELCYPILESDKVSFMDKIVSIEKGKNSLLELRIDYLLGSGVGIDEIVMMINYIHVDLTSKKIIVTIRTENEGGKIKIDSETYYDYIEKLYLNTSVEYLDVEYALYQKNADKFDKLFKNKFKKIILSSHMFDGALAKHDYEILFDSMMNLDIDIVKCAVMVNTKKELFNFMMTARKCSKNIKKQKKECIFIAMGAIGGLSRLWPEFTNTKVVFLTAYGEKASKIGQFTYENFVKYRKLLEKNVKN